MKTMTCRQLGGACDTKFSANTFAEIAGMSKKHGMEMYQKGDKPHLKAMEQMKELMKSPTAMNEWFDIKLKEFETLPVDE